VPVNAQSPPPLQALLNDTVAQLQLAYRHNAPERRRRYDQLAVVLAAWRDAPRSDANNQLLEDWLRGAIRSSMPGSQLSLPGIPNFGPATIPAESGSEEPTAPATQSMTRSSKESDNGLPPDDTPAADAEVTESEPWEADPFADDPEQGAMVEP
jgi:hypothetical protein